MQLRIQRVIMYKGLKEYCFGGRDRLGILGFGIEIYIIANIKYVYIIQICIYMYMLILLIKFIKV
jgi:hypothetical protein